MKLWFVIIAITIWQALIVICTITSVRYLPVRDKFFGGMETANPRNPNPFLKNPVLYSRANYDGIHYINIASKGSIGVGQQAFFPLYIKLLTLLKPVFRNLTVTGVAISLISFIIGSFIFIKLLLLDYSSSVSKWIYISLLIFPTSFYFSFVYTEGLFFLLSVSAFYFARTRRWWLAGLTGALAAYTRVTGIILFPALLIELFNQSGYSLSRMKKDLKPLLPLFLIPLGLFLFMWQLNQSIHDPLAFIHVQSSFSQGRSANLILLPQVYWRYFKIFATFNRSDPLFYTILLEFFTTSLFLVLGVISFIKHRLSYSFFNFTCFILPTLTGTFTSMPRYVLAGFPAFILIGVHLAKIRPVYRYTYLSLSLLLGFVFLSLFVRGFWVS
jgi:Gpi18-like mannosyltransferase